ncbi:hypothetical protein AVEN_150271-1 [Araneus ventricosus]|uniref:Uncharacterized protein n=1 Tax=Araneus ventricosus TaxID=182803 RepID=A0A4Y2HCW8_ARAVE|nr:hypothetical protein AVEN_150271-1 [Araneus ventricosus]
MVRLVHKPTKRVHTYKERNEKGLLQEGKSHQQRKDGSFFAMKSVFVCMLALALMAACHAESYSMACSTGPDGKMRCIQKQSPDGSFAGSSSFSNGQGGGRMMVGAGQPGNMQYRYNNV